MSCQFWRAMFVGGLADAGTPHTSHDRTDETSTTHGKERNVPFNYEQIEDHAPRVDHYIRRSSAQGYSVCAKQIEFMCDLSAEETQAALHEVLRNPVMPAIVTTMQLVGGTWTECFHAIPIEAVRPWRGFGQHGLPTT